MNNIRVSVDMNEYGLDDQMTEGRKVWSTSIATFDTRYYTQYDKVIISICICCVDTFVNKSNSINCFTMLVRLTVQMLGLL